MSDTKLKPCPFCGVKLYKHQTYWHHEESDCILGSYEIFEEEVEKWNTRRPMERIVKQLEGIKKCGGMKALVYNQGVCDSIEIVQKEGME